MLSAIFSQLIVSFFTRNLLGRGYFLHCCDVLNVYTSGNMKNANGVIQRCSGAALMDCSLNVSLFQYILYFFFFFFNTD